MIHLEEKNDPSDLDIFQEGSIKDILKAGNIDADKVKEDWKNASADPKTAIHKKADIVNDTLEKGNKTVGGVNNYLNKHAKVNNASIIARAKNSVLQFPVYITPSIPTNAAHTVGKMFERVYTTFVQTVLSQNQIIDEEDAANLVFLKQFHTNIKESAEVIINKYYEAIDDMDQMMCESIFHTERINENCFIEFRVVPTDEKLLITENTRLMNEPLAGFFYLKEAKDANSKVTDTNIKSVETVGAKEEKVYTPEELEKIANAAGLKINGGAHDGEADVDALTKKIREGKIEYPAGNKIKARKGRDGNWEYYSSKVDGKTITTTTQTGEKRFRDSVEAPKLLKDSDIKKMNGLLPYTIEATFRLRTKEGLDRDVKYLIGIKTVMHLISVKDLSEDLREIVTGNIKSLQKVRYTTGEIGFKDYYFNIKGLKADAAKHINYDKRWLNTLKRLGEYDKMNGTLLKKGIQAITGGHVPIPNGTMVLAQGDVTKLVNETGIDLSLVSNVKRLAKALFLIGVVIIDATAGTMRVIFPDSDSSWDVQSLSSIDAELSKTDNSQLMKELNRMVNK